MKNLVFVFLLFILYSCSSPKEKEKHFDEVNDKTDFVLSLKEPINLSKNIFYCSTLGYAWDEVKKRYNNNIDINAEYEYLRLLNNDTSFKNTLVDSLITTNVIVDDNIATISSTLKVELPFAFKSYFKHDPEQYFSQDFVLEMTLDEQRELLKEHHSKFNDELVVTFGSKFSDNETGAVKSVDLLYYKNNNSFAIRLQPADVAHEIILYQPENTNFSSLYAIIDSLQYKMDSFSIRKKTLNAIYDRLSENSKLSLIEELQKNGITRKDQSNLYLNEGDEFSVPILNLANQKSFKKLKDNFFNITEKIESCKQVIEFALNEKGAKVTSNAELVVVSVGGSPYKKELYFNKPFLVLVKLKNSNNPYLAGWIANTDVMKTKRISF